MSIIGFAGICLLGIRTSGISILHQFGWKWKIAGHHIPQKCYPDHFIQVVKKWVFQYINRYYLGCPPSQSQSPPGLWSIFSRESQPKPSFAKSQHRGHTQGIMVYKKIDLQVVRKLQDLVSEHFESRRDRFKNFLLTQMDFQGISGRVSGLSGYILSIRDVGTQYGKWMEMVC